jgi:hypothetical protein
MQYLLLIYEDEAVQQGMNEAEFNARLGRYFALTEELQGKGIMLGGQPLAPTQTATSVRVRDAQMVTTDGPFAETKEQLIGFYMIDCENLDEALKWAAKIPSSESGTIEVRPVAQH